MGSPVTAATDVSRVGLLLYRCLAGILPWDAHTPTEMIAAHHDRADQEPIYQKTGARRGGIRGHPPPE